MWGEEGVCVGGGRCVWVWGEGVCGVRVCVWGEGARGVCGGRVCVCVCGVCV